MTHEELFNQATCVRHMHDELLKKYREVLESALGPRDHESLSLAQAVAMIDQELRVETLRWAMSRFINEVLSDWHAVDCLKWWLDSHKDGEKKD